MPKRSLGTALLVIGPAVFVAFGLLVDGAERFDRLRISVQRTPASLPSSRTAPDELIDLGVPVVSVYADSSQLNDPDTGLLASRGRETDLEIPATVSYFDHGRLVFASGVGLRVHGDRPGESPAELSYRLHFRRQYGGSQVMPGVWFDGRSDPLTTVVARRTQRLDAAGRAWHLVNPLAYDIATRVGAIAPYTQPAELVVNGEGLGLYVLTEHVRAPFFRARFGHANFIRADNEMEDALRRVVGEMSSATMPAVGQLIDIESLTRWFLSVVFCATSDPFQAVILRDQARPDARWFWVHWDMDESFMGTDRAAGEPWEHDTVGAVLGKESVESETLTRLIADDANYRRYLVETATDALNHRLTPGFLQKRFEHYRALAENHDVEQRDYFEILERFLRSRHPPVRAQLSRHLGLGPAFRVEVTTSDGIDIEVDGYRKVGSYEGWYFDGSEVVITMADERADFSHWLVNEQRVSSRALRHRVVADTVVTPVFLDS